MENCIFCKIIGGQIPSKRFYEDDKMIIIADIEPKAKIHFLAIPKNHYKLFADMTSDDQKCLGDIFKTIADVAPSLGLESGYRLVINQGEDAGQTVFHLHIHILGGEVMPFENVSK